MEEAPPFVQDTLQMLSFVAKPKPSAKLLSKPPFRFLHDLVNAVIQATGFPAGLYSDAELNHENIQSKQDKQNFLDKLIACVSLASNQPLPVRSSKIVAGLEPEATNLLLQHMAHHAIAAQQGAFDVAELVSRTLSGAQPGDDAALQQQEQQQQLEAEAAAAAEQQRQQQLMMEQQQMQELQQQQWQQQAAQAEFAQSQEMAAPSSTGGRASTAKRRSLEAPLGDTGPQEPLSSVDWVRATQQMLGAVIQKPRLTEKLLSKPPFRFLHDVVMAVQQTTGFPGDIFAPEEMDAKSIQDTKIKVNFLKKVKDAVCATRGVDLPVNPKKIIAGLEPELTNQLLQELALAVAPAPAQQPPPRPQRQQSARRVEEAPPTPQQQIQSEPEPVPETVPQIQRQPSAGPRRSSGRHTGMQEALGQSGQPVLATPLPKLPLEEITNQTQAAAPRVREPEEDNPYAPAATLDLSQPQSGPKIRPRSAVRTVPKSQSRLDNQVDPNAENAAGPAPTGLIREGEPVVEENIQEQEEEQQAAEVLPGFGSGPEGINGARGEHGKLVRDILKAQQEADNSKNQGGVTFRRLGAANQQNKVLSAQQMEEIRLQIQQLCQSANPLGKCVDFVYEDLDHMNRELAMWRRSYEEQTKQLEQERSATEDILQPLKEKLALVQKSLDEEDRNILQINAAILKNSANIKQILANQ